MYWLECSQTKCHSNQFCEILSNFWQLLCAHHLPSQKQISSCYYPAWTLLQAQEDHVENTKVLKHWMSETVSGASFFLHDLMVLGICLLPCRLEWILQILIPGCAKQALRGRGTGIFLPIKWWSSLRASFSFTSSDLFRLTVT